jgi:hypothetical protein
MADLSISTDVIQHGDGMRAILARMLSRMGRSAWSTLATPGQTFLSSASRTTTTISSAIDARGYKGIGICLRWTTTDATQTLRIDALGSVLDTLALDFTFAQTANLTVATLARHVLLVYPGNGVATPSQGTLSPSVLPPYVACRISHGNANPVTYEVRYCLIP